jgi:cytosine/adenosine deaminase-related metal-dependent hydrolase
MVNTRQVNIGVFSEPAHMLVEAAQPANVDTVVVDGKILKRAGVLTRVDAGEVVDAASAAYARVHERSGWSWPERRG